MTGDQADIIGRIKSTLPVGWFPDDSPMLDSLLGGVAQAWSWIYDWISYVGQQTRITTAAGVWLDLAAVDYFGADLPRRPHETDEHFSKRIHRNLLRKRGTRCDVISALTDLTGRSPDVFEPARCSDTGAYGIDPASSGGLSYNAVGGWGSLALPFQCFITAYRPVPSGIAFVSGWCCYAGGYGGGVIQYVDLALMEDQISDMEIYGAISLTLPVATIGWTRIAS
ncbi:MAG: hypothetical protein P4L71_08525 [Acetobacteraceae bacterium]|nr:hypothetical protein [Acetobacteraceae bacterium]